MLASSQTSQTSYQNKIALKQRYFTPNEAHVVAAVANRTNGHSTNLHKPFILDKSLMEAVKIIRPKNDDKPHRIQTLDGFSLLEASEMGFPEDAIQISLVGKNFDQVIEEDLLFFSNVMYLDVSENQLNFYHFYLLQSLKELRIACNNITKITFPPPKNTKVNINFNIFESLMILDISYNHLNLSSIEAIADYAPYLKELDLCGNELMEIPTKMWKYGSLEKLNMSHNRLDDPQIFIWLGQMPKLRFLSLSYNLLSAAPEALKSSDKFFRLLDTIDLSFNYFANSEALQPIVFLPSCRLYTAIIYGNPLLGPTGEDPLHIYIEELENSSLEFRKEAEAKDIEIITEIPRVRVKKGQALGRQAYYQTFEVAKVQEDSKECQKRNVDWREEGHRTLFAEAIALARKQQTMEKSQSDFTFLTSVPGISSTSTIRHAGQSSAVFNALNEDEDRTTDVADKVMLSVATQMGLNQNKETSEIAKRAQLPPTLMSKILAIQERTKREDGQITAEEANRIKLTRSWMRSGSSNEGYGDRLTSMDDNILNSSRPFSEITKLPYLTTDARQQQTNSKETPQDVGDSLIPLSLLKKPPPAKRSHDSQNLTRNMHPVEMQTAIKALRFALKYPLTSHNDVPARGFLPPKDYAQLTVTAQNKQRQKSKKEESRKSTLACFDVDPEKEKQRRRGRGLKEPPGEMLNRARGRETTLDQIGQVLDGMIHSTNEIKNRDRVSNTSQNNVRETVAKLEAFAKPTSGISELVNMINNVIEDCS